MIDLKPKLKFKEIGVDANQKDQTRTLEDEKSWENHFEDMMMIHGGNTPPRHITSLLVQAPI